MTSVTTAQGKRLRGGSFSPEGSKSSSISVSRTTPPSFPFPLVSNCSQYTQKLPSQEIYETLLRAYRIARNNSKATLGKFHSENAQIRFGKDTNNGRGLYATRTLEKGEMIYESATTITTFPTEESYVHFLTQLEPSLQCDALLWSYSTDDRVIIALDENCCVNHSGKDMNIGYQHGGSYFANRRIEKDEEILDNYSNYMSFNAIEWFERIRRNAWGGTHELHSASETVTILQDDTLEANLYLRQGVVQPVLEKDRDAKEGNNDIIVGIKIANPVFCVSLGHLRRGNMRALWTYPTNAWGLTSSNSLHCLKMTFCLEADFQHCDILQSSWPLNQSIDVIAIRMLTVNDLDPSSSQSRDDSSTSTSLLGAAESRRVRITKLIFFSGLAAAATITGVVIFRYASNGQEQEFVVGFTGSAEELILISQLNMENKFSSLEALAISITTAGIQGNDSGNTWLYFTHPNFEVEAGNIRENIGSILSYGLH
ncbi:SET methyltransferase domain containing protein [Nitzschia inconspicua]|uniref:SET methyltransferase domain containing protein n=1 Tax=Nitzschia inconspicua TaxID=303405 RepID=A0A9K3KJL3_9STRA|nr:SET methyltransferase domain containing protein [Nitzschia inconspicua]